MDMLDLAAGLTDTYAHALPSPGLVGRGLSIPADATLTLTLTLTMTLTRTLTLTLAGARGDRSRLGCQIKVSEALRDTVIRIPDEMNNLYGSGAGRSA